MLQEGTLHCTMHQPTPFTQSIPITNKVETQTGIILSKNQFLRHKSSSVAAITILQGWQLKSGEIVANIERKWRKHSINGKNRGYSTATVSNFHSFGSGARGKKCRHWSSLSQNFSHSLVRSLRPISDQKKGSVFLSFIINICFLLCFLIISLSQHLNFYEKTFYLPTFMCCYKCFCSSLNKQVWMWNCGRWLLENCEAQGEGRAKSRLRKVTQRSFIDCRLSIIVYFP